MRKVFAVVVLTLLASGVNALPEFDYSSYTLPDYSVKGLEFRFPGLGFNAYSYDGNPIQEYQTRANMSLDGTYYVEYYRQGWELDYQVGGGVSYDYEKNEDGSRHDKEYEGSLNIAGRYYISGLLFVTGRGGFHYLDSKDNMDESVRKSHRTYYITGAGAGYGRLYNLKAMRRAQAVIDELYSAGLLTRYPNQADLAAFGDLLYELQMGRVLDSRLKRIEDFNRIDAFLNEKMLLKEENIAYFTILNDMLTYATIGSRYNGTRIEFSVNSSESTDFERIESPYLYDSHTNNLSGIIYLATMEIEKILNRYWQWGIFAGWQNQTSDRIRTAEPDREYKMSAAIISSELTWYPNTRTRVGFGGSFDYQAEKEEVNGTRMMDEHLFSLGISCDADYYFSPHLGLNGSFQLRNFKNRDKISGEDTSSVGTTMSLQLIYKVF